MPFWTSLLAGAVGYILPSPILWTKLYSQPTDFLCLLDFTSDNCWGSSYPSSRRRRRSTHDDEGNSGGGGIGGGTICISGT